MFNYEIKIDKALEWMKKEGFDYAHLVHGKLNHMILLAIVERLDKQIELLEKLLEVKDAK